MYVSQPYCRDVLDPDTGIQQNATRYFEIGETGVKTLEQELKSCLTSRIFICRLPDLFQVYLNFNCKLH